MKSFMRGLLVFILTLISILELPVVMDVPTKKQASLEHEVSSINFLQKKTEEASQDSSPSPFDIKPASSLASTANSGFLVTKPKNPTMILDSQAPNISNSPSATSTPNTLSTPNTPSTPSTPNTPSKLDFEQKILLDHEISLKNQELNLSLPNLDLQKKWLVEVEYQLISEETLMGFDQPGFKIFLDDKLVYQENIDEEHLMSMQTLSFNPLGLSAQPQVLSFWAGNSGDKLADTQVILRQVIIKTDEGSYFSETELVDDLKIYVDNNDYTTLQWSAPQTNDARLQRVLAYEVRYATTTITAANWFQAHLVEGILPQQFSPQLAAEEELLLIKTPQIQTGFMAVRSLNSMGEYSPVGINAPFSY